MLLMWFSYILIYSNISHCLLYLDNMQKHFKKTVNESNYNWLKQLIYTQTCHCRLALPRTVNLQY